MPPLAKDWYEAIQTKRAFIKGTSSVMSHNFSAGQNFEMVYSLPGPKRKEAR